MTLTEFSRAKWERAIDLKKRGQYPETERELKEALDIYENLHELNPGDSFRNLPAKRKKQTG